METKDYLLLGVVLIGVVGFIVYKAVVNPAPTETPQAESESTLNSLINESANTGMNQSTPSNSSQEQTPKRYSNVPVMQLDLTKNYKAVMHTSKGDITIDLFEGENPVTVNNFVFLAKEGFYNNTKFHRIIKNFMVQGGDPLGNGTGNPGYRFADEAITRDYNKGIIAMANSGPNTNGSQFFIMHADYPLPKNYVIFGQVTDEAGLAVVDAIANTPVGSNGMGENSRPLEEVLVTSVDVLEE